MRIVISMDSFKGSLTSLEAANAIKRGILDVYDRVDISILPLADGGEGTVDALVEGMYGEEELVVVSGPLKEKVTAKYGILRDSKTAIIEMAQAAGLTLVKSEELNPLNTTTYGVGEIIKDAIQKGCRNFIVGIGGSSTNDAGVGMLQALGFEFYDENNNKVGLGGKVLNKIKSINVDNRMKELDECTFKIACDVNNPLYGINGAAYVYGPQKGATEEIIEELDNGLKNFAGIVNKELADTPGCGAAGGLGFGFLAFLNSSLKSGVDIVLEEIKFKEVVKGADIVITGEGRLDCQTAMGKSPMGAARIAKELGAKVIAIVGSTTADATKCNAKGIDAYFSIVNSAMTIEEAMKKETAIFNMESTTRQIFNLIKLMENK